MQKLLVTFLSTVGYLGKFPVAPGTFTCCVMALVFVFFPSETAMLALFPVSTILGLAIAKPAVALFQDSDPKAFVIDEVAGFSLALLTIPLTPTNLVIALLAFRFFDIVKPFGVRTLDQLHHPVGIVLDDLLAGFYTLIVMKGLLYLGVTG